MLTTRPAPERSHKVFNWTVNELENNKGYEFITPQGYIFGVASKDLALQLISDISWGGQIHGTMYGDIHLVEEGIIRAWSPEPWINKGWEHMHKICRVSHLIDVIVAYAQDQWIN